MIWKHFMKNKNSSSKILRKYHSFMLRFLLDYKGSYIGYSAKFSNKPVFPHGIRGIFISGSAVIGRNCVIFHHVTIGSNTLPDSKGKGAPILGDNVYIGAGAKIIGNVRIGDNVRIGANCVVTQDVPDNAVVVLNKPTILQREELDNRYYSFRYGEWVYFEDGKWKTEHDEDKLQQLQGVR